MTRILEPPDDAERFGTAALLFAHCDTPQSSRGLLLTGAKATVEGIRCHVPCGGMRAHPVELGFHIADAEDVALAYDGESLMLSFLDWRQQPVRVAFDEAVAFRWQRADEVHPGESWDGTNVHLDSPWLEEHRRQGEATTSHQHFALNFNAAGRLEVVSTGARVVAG